jgi:serine/threonine protein kinase
MGEVYKAKDTRLERTVAVKVLPQHLSASPEIRQRFEREAKTISQLSHSNICALYDVGNADGVEYLVMELLEGETLSDRLAKARCRSSRRCGTGRDHGRAGQGAPAGIVHRDLKPGNVMITKSGVKLLDFAVGQSDDGSGADVGDDVVPTMMGTANNLTQEGTIWGRFSTCLPSSSRAARRTAERTSSPSAASCTRWRRARRRSRATQASLISSIMKEEPAPISAVAPMTPPALERVVRRCLAKDPEDRWQNAGDLGSELKWIAEGGSQSGIAAPVSASGRRRSSWLTWAVALLLAALGFAAGRLLQRPAETPVTRSSIDLPPQMDLERWSSIALSPDGSMLVFSATGADGKRELWIRRLDGFARPGSSLERRPASCRSGRPTADPSAFSPTGS